MLTTLRPLAHIHASPCRPQYTPPSPIDAVNGTTRDECGCLKLKALMESANLALADLVVSPYSTDTSTALPLEVCQTCLELLNSAATVNVIGAGAPNATTSGGAVVGRRLLQSSDNSTTMTTSNSSECPFALANATNSSTAPEADPSLPAASAPLTYTPTATDDLYYCDFGVPCSRTAAAGVLVNDTTPNAGGNMTVSGVASPPSGGSLTLNTNGSFVYTPAPGFSGTMMFVYLARDGVEPVNVTATVTLIIAPPPPLTGANYSWTMPGDAGTYYPGVSLLANVTANPGANVTIVGISSPPTFGNVTLSPNGSYLFTSPPGWFGELLRGGMGEALHLLEAHAAGGSSLASNCKHGSCLRSGRAPAHKRTSVLLLQAPLPSAST